MADIEFTEPEEYKTNAAQSRSWAASWLMRHGLASSERFASLMLIILALFFFLLSAGILFFGTPRIAPVAPVQTSATAPTHS